MKAKHFEERYAYVLANQIQKFIDKNNITEVVSMSLIQTGEKHFHAIMIYKT